MGDDPASLLVQHPSGWLCGQPHCWPPNQPGTTQRRFRELHVDQPHIFAHTGGPLPPRHQDPPGFPTHLYANRRLPAPGEALCSEHPRYSCSASPGPGRLAETPPASLTTGLGTQERQVKHCMILGKDPKCCPSHSHSLP